MQLFCSNLDIDIDYIFGDFLRQRLIGEVLWVRRWKMLFYVLARLVVDVYVAWTRIRAILHPWQQDYKISQTLEMGESYPVGRSGRGSSVMK